MVTLWVFQIISCGHRSATGIYPTYGLIMNLFRSSTKASRAYPTHLRCRQDFSHFYDYYAPMLYGHLLDQIKNTSVAEAILADVFSTFWQERAAFQENQSRTTKQAPLSWLLSIAHRKEFDK